MRSFVSLIFASVIALSTASSGRSALADIVSKCASGTPDETIAACLPAFRKTAGNDEATGSEVIRDNAKASWAYVNRGLGTKEPTRFHARTP